MNGRADKTLTTSLHVQLLIFISQSSSTDNGLTISHCVYFAVSGQVGHHLCEISGYYNSEYENGCLLGNDHHDDGDSKHLWYVGQLIPDYMAHNPNVINKRKGKVKWSPYMPWRRFG
jgi:hypothetical protein